MKQIFLANLESWGWTHHGTVREDNQDSFLNWPSHTLWAVADGVGGGSNGAVASKMIISSLMNIPIPASFAEHLDSVRHSLNQVNIKLFAAAGGSSVTASTVVALLIYEDNVACLWAGDSRCYLLRGGVLYQCTSDHTLRQQKIQTGDLTAPEANRMIQGNIITNAVGIDKELKLEQVTFSLKAEDRFLLCSDGVSNLLSAEAILRHLSGNTAREAAFMITETLGNLPQPDNVTFVAVFISGINNR
ncbi:MAG: serine/threonine-protein phosphatase [Desulfarculales bacterium]|jgi:serine/threonine protein phosphatase PrpC|nr:serine/threonine-protein phosphatase [Desulfarculales bacterium]